MDYSSFVRSFYRYAFTKLKEYKNYYGKIVQVSKGLDIPDEFLFVEENESLFLPQQSVNINAPTKYFNAFMDYIVEMMPDLGVVLANDKRIGDLYNNVLEMNILEDNDKVSQYIELVVGVGISALEAQGILEK